MAVAYDISFESHTTGTVGSQSQASFAWTHTPTGTPRGVVVFVFSQQATSLATSVTYGASTLTDNGAAYEAADTVTEPGFWDTFFLGASVPTGAQTVTVNRTNSAISMYAVSITVTAAGDVETFGPVLLQNNQAYAEQSVDDGSPGTDSTRFAACYYGGATNPPAGANSALLQSFLFSASSITVVREGAPGQGARLVGCTQVTSDDCAAVHLAVREPPAAAAGLPNIMMAPMRG